MDLARDLLPVRSTSDKLAGRVRLDLGGEVFDLPVLTIRQNKVFKEELVARVTALVGRFENQDEVGELIAIVARSTDIQLEVLAKYDLSGGLPIRDWLEDNATEQELLAALMEVLAAAFPLADALRQRLPELLSMIGMARPSPTSSALPSTAGVPLRSVPSPTSSSSSTSTERPNGSPNDEPPSSATPSRPSGSGPSRPPTRTPSGSGARRVRK